MNQVVAAESRSVDVAQSIETEDFVTFFIDKQLFGIPVLQVQDILTPDSIASIPLAPPEVAGSINLRGRIVTVIDVRTRLGLPKREEGDMGMGVTVEHVNDLYTFLVDKVGEVLSMQDDDFEKNPNTLDPLWRDFANGVYRLEGRLMVILDVDKLLAFKGMGIGEVPA